MEDDETFKFEKLVEDAHVVSGAEHPWARFRFDVTERPRASWGLPTKARPPGAIVASAFAACGLDYPRATLTAALPEARIGMLATGRYLTVFPNSVLVFPTKRPGLRIHRPETSSCGAASPASSTSRSVSKSVQSNGGN